MAGCYMNFTGLCSGNHYCYRSVVFGVVLEWGIAGQETTFFSSLQLPSGGALCFVVQPAAALLPN